MESGVARERQLLRLRFIETGRPGNLRRRASGGFNSVSLLQSPAIAKKTANQIQGGFDLDALVRVIKQRTAAIVPFLLEQAVFLAPDDEIFVCAVEFEDKHLGIK